MSPPAERRRTKEKPTGVTFRSRRFFICHGKAPFAPDCTGWETRFYQPAVPFVTTGFPSASSSGVNPPAYPLTMKR